MSEMLGADVEELRALARDFSGNSQKLSQAQKLLDGAVNQFPRYWQGPDAQRFAAQWRGQHRGVIARTATMLDETANELNKNAREQEQASSVASLGGPAGVAGNSTNPWGPDWLSKGSPFRDGWKQYSNVKNAINLPKNIYALTWMAQKGAGYLDDPAQWAKLAGRSAPFNIMDSATDLLGLKNLNKYFPQLNSMKGFFAEAPKFFKGTDLEWLGKSGLGRGVGWLSVGLSAFDTVQKGVEGDIGGAIYSGAKTALGVACFLPPPAGTVAQIASAGWAIYEIPAVKSFVDNGVKSIGAGITAAVTDPGKFVNDVGKGIEDLGKGAAKFFGFG
ncbi:WXG100 family type VII secretion target [Arthrobacter sp.]|uniref:WXG100 family type VII secretion target n=1 Tax=Arthrobacter sp. TaxID=1667 RepID=UPI0026DF3B2F|nr:WXG100 family type VII secretion target [Arthrobacter sp.]MDO5752255.1 WXG100 family type VII secretion target [Arthrobacter sp.]